MKITKILFLTILPVLTFYGFGIGEVKANGNVYGWAWSENIGWISFNNVGITGIPAGGGAINYGVNIETNGNLSGYAWSENIGWVSFSPVGPYPTVPNYSVCVDLPSSGQACDGIGNYNVSGWARVCSVFQTGCSGTLNSNRGGWDGWIKLHNIHIDTSVTPAQFHYYVWGGNPDNDPLKSVIGWGTFNCAEGSPSGTTVCGTSNYKVVTNFPFITGTCNLTGPSSVSKNGSANFSLTYSNMGGTPTNITPSCGDGATVAVNPAPICNSSGCTFVCNNYTTVGGPYTVSAQIQKDSTFAQCEKSINVLNNQAPVAIPGKPDQGCFAGVSFGWTYFDQEGDIQTKFDFQVADNSSFSSPEIDRTINSSISTGQSAEVVSSATPGKLLFNKTYYWRVKVYNANGDSGWVPGPSFKTSAHSWPAPEFTFKPPTPFVNNVVTFIDSSKCYDNSNNWYYCADCDEQEGRSCEGIPGTPPSPLNNTYLWEFGDGATNGVEGNTSHKYITPVTKKVWLTVCDLSLAVNEYSGCCSTDRDVPVRSPVDVPEWKEISPF